MHYRVHEKNDIEYQCESHDTAFIFVLMNFKLLNQKQTFTLAFNLKTHCFAIKVEGLQL